MLDDHCCDEQCGSSIIDLSTPDTLQRDFNNWLNQQQQTENESIYGSPQSDCGGSSNGEKSVKDEIVTEPEKKIITDGRKNRKKGSGTNLYGRPYCPGRPLSMDERRRIIELHSGGMKVNAISKLLCISHGCVSKIISRFRATGVLLPACSPEQRKSRKRKTEEPTYIPEYVIPDPNGNDYMNMYPIVQQIPQDSNLQSSYYQMIS
ncbi:unnamed protein product [Caenorhabditis angaria]|uniref:Paired domain-containing protein n=1 Tax=Caenorhabditis angaria TaxID=860376 RepID=A0A9P1N477_9PELO|nr:unnamed protein product [Caenorhabditis angaria]